MIFCILMAVFILGLIVCKCWGEANEHDTLGLYLVSIALLLIVVVSSVAAGKYLSLVIN